MKYLCYLFLFVSINIYGQSNHVVKFPNYNVVKNKLCNNYIFDYDGFFHLEKRKEGWVWVKLIYENEKLSEKERLLVWSAKNKNFLPLSYNKKDKENFNCEDNLNVSKWEKLYFNVSPYYGYNKWSDDLIAAAEKNENLSDSMLFMLGRAYSEHATNFFSSQYYPIGEPIWDLPKTNNALTTEQLNTYLFYRDKVYKTYQKLTKINPNFQTVVGSINIKYGNEYGTTFWDLCMLQNETEAQKVYNKPLYNKSYTMYAKNLLNSCDTNAILITNGDNDTYPLLYVQSFLGFRKDVLVVNISMLNLTRYINMLKNKLMDAAPAPISWESNMTENVSSFVKLKNNETDILPLKSLLEAAITGKKEINTNKFYYLTEKGDSLNIHFEKQKFLILSDIIILEMIAEGKFQRPIYFSHGINFDNISYLKPYLIEEGFAYKMTDSLQPYANYYTENFNANAYNLNVDKTYQKYVQTFDWEGVSQLSKEDINLAETYIKAAATLACGLADQGEKEKALQILTKSYQDIHAEGLPSLISDVLMVNAYYNMQEMEKGNMLAQKIAKDIKTHNMPVNRMPFTESKQEYEKHLSEMLLYIRNKHGQTEDILK